MGSVYGGALDAQGTYPAYQVGSGKTVLSSSPTTLHRILVVTTGTAASTGNVWDTNATGSTSAANLVFTTPGTQPSGSILEFHWPCTTGLTVNPGVGNIWSIVYS